MASHRILLVVHTSSLFDLLLNTFQLFHGMFLMCIHHMSVWVGEGKMWLYVLISIQDSVRLQPGIQWVEHPQTECLLIPSFLAT